MRIKYFCPLWGSEHLPWEIFLEKVKGAGYNGIEAFFPLNLQDSEKSKIKRLLQAFELELIGQHCQTTDLVLKKHLEVYEAHLQNLAYFEPIFINSQTGRDCFSFQENKAVIELAQTFSEREGIKVVHETHRGKFSFCTTNTKLYLDTFPDLRLTADFSHWCNVAESLLQDQQHIVTLAIQRADHIHARIGFAQGPQINDPRSPEWKETVDCYLSWWDAIIEAKREQGADMLTISPEFGPSPYTPVLPFTNQPVTSQWDVNCYMMDLLKKRYHYTAKILAT
jgi:sugar phosphate isomerase/epimerase